MVETKFRAVGHRELLVSETLRRRDTARRASGQGLSGAPSQLVDGGQVCAQEPAFTPLATVWGAQKSARPQGSALHVRTQEAPDGPRKVPGSPHSRDVACMGGARA